MKNRLLLSMPMKRCPHHLLRRALMIIALVCAISSARADTFVYDNANRLSSSTQSNGISYSYSCDEEANLLSAGANGSDTTTSGETANGIPDWWENYYFGTTGIDPLASYANDGISNLMKYALGLNPLVPFSGPLVTASYQTYTDGKSYPYLTYTCSIGAASLVVLQQSSDLVTWYSGSQYFQQVSVQDLGNGTEQIVVRCLTSLPNAANLHFRLEATGVSDALSSYYTITSPQGIPAMPGWAFVSLAVLLPFVMARFLRSRSTAL